MRVKESRGDRVFGIAVNVALALCVLACAYPIYLVIINSFSDPNLVAKGDVWWRPIGFTLDAYKEVFKNGDIMRGYANSLYYTIFGTALNMVLTIPAAYALSKPQLFGRNIIMKLLVFTMYFSGGLVPHYMLMQGLGLLNTRMSVLVVGAVSTTNLIIARTFFSSSIPKELEEAAEIDGCSVLQTFMQIVMPLSKAMLSVIMLYYAVGRWNNYTSSLYYQPLASELQPLQMVLRRILITMQQNVEMNQEEADYYAKLANMIKYAAIVVASVPLLIIYPFIQKYFEKGVMMGSVKG